jgi:hypothetical protein
MPKRLLFRHRFVTVQPPGSNAPALEPLGITTLERGNEVGGNNSTLWFQCSSVGTLGITTPERGNEVGGNN